MNALLVLMMIQMIGVVLAFGVSAFIRFREQRKTFISERFKEQIWKSGEHWQWMIDYFEQNPRSRLKSTFPYLYKVARATKQYKDINRLKAQGRLSERRYQKRLRKILSIINIKVDLNAVEKDRNFS